MPLSDLSRLLLGITLANNGAAKELADAIDAASVQGVASALSGQTRQALELGIASHGAGKEIADAIDLSNSGGVPGLLSDQARKALELLPLKEVADAIDAFPHASALVTGLAGWWDLDEAAGNSRSDGSGNGWTLSETGGSVNSAAGLVGNAADGFQSTLTYLKNASPPVAAAPYAMACWIKAASFNSTRKWFAIGSTSPLFGSVSTGTGALQWLCGLNQQYIVGHTLDGTWIHLAGTHDGTTQKFYVNGVLRVSGASTPDVPEAVAVGAGTGGATPAPGSVDMAGVWSRALGDGGVSVGQAAAAGSDVYKLYQAGLARVTYPWSGY